MKKVTQTMYAPAVGCMMGTAYQKLLGELAMALKNAGLDITPGEYLVMRAVYNNDGIQQCEIVETLGKDKSTVCRLVASLERKGLIKTEAVSYKCLRAYVTEMGREIEPRIMSVANLRHQALAEITTSQELEIFTKVLNKIIQRSNKT